MPESCGDIAEHNSACVGMLSPDPRSCIKSRAWPHEVPVTQILWEKGIDPGQQGQLASCLTPGRVRDPFLRE